MSTNLGAPHFEKPTTEQILDIETAPILSKKVVGKEDVDIAAMIEKLGNSDWVREGVHYHEVNDDTCPFCQQRTSDAFSQNLMEYFDETYVRDLDAIKTLKQSYTSCAKQLQDAFDDIHKSESPFVDLVQFKAQLDLFTEKSSVNIGIFQRKENEPSSVVTLEPLNAVLTELLDLIENANAKIAQHNNLVENNEAERTRLQKEVWRYVVDDAQAHIDVFNQKARAIEQAIESLTTQIDRRGNDLVQKREELNALERRGTNIQSTVSEINKTLSDFGFKGFSLAAAENAGYYKIIRPDGEDAHTNLSEGEKTFVTFLYFFHWLKGSLSQSGVMADRVAVFDDPVSSLDSEVLFIVSTLIKSAIDSIAAGGPIKQIFLMTHNMYFFKEVSFISNKKKRAPGSPKTYYSYWIVTKRDEVSNIEKHENNPVKSAYQMLWDEVKNPDNSRHTIRNTLRRILEYYFNTIGSWSLDELPDLFTGDEQSICRSLISWVQEGSHFTDDDYTVVPSIETVDRQLAVFKRIFEETKHIEHFNMMMGEGIHISDPNAINDSPT